MGTRTCSQYLGALKSDYLRRLFILLLNLMQSVQGVLIYASEMTWSMLCLVSAAEISPKHSQTLNLLGIVLLLSAN